MSSASPSATCGGDDEKSRCSGVQAPHRRRAVNRIAWIAAAGTLVLVGAGYTVNRLRPARDVERASAAEVKATGRCAECHRLQTAGIVKQYEDSQHARAGVTCLDCHKPRDAAHAMEHKGFQITRGITSGSCAECHRREYQEFE